MLVLVAITKTEKSTGGIGDVNNNNNNNNNNKITRNMMMMMMMMMMMIQLMIK